MVLGSTPIAEPSSCWFAPSRLPSRLSKPKRAGVSPTDSSAAAMRVCEARQSRKKSCPANSLTAVSGDGVGEDCVAIPVILVTRTWCCQSFVLPIIYTTNDLRDLEVSPHGHRHLSTIHPLNRPRQAHPRPARRRRLHRLRRRLDRERRASL